MVTRNDCRGRGLLVFCCCAAGTSPKPAPRRVPAATSMAAPRRPQVDRVAELLVTRVIDETADAKTFVFTVSPDQAAGFNYEPGQHLTLRIPSDVTGSVARCYLVECARRGFRSAGDRQADTRRIRVELVVRQLASRDADPVVAPRRSFTTSPGMSELFLFAGGSGITP